MIEPETGISILDLGLVRVTREGGELVITYIPVSAYTPPILSMSIGIQILKKCEKVKVMIDNYYLKDEINRRLEAIRNELSRISSKTIT
ncbi:hypothetical protein [Saccharolobus shibatae]|uniref:Uncharacterized protein n=1 Tax=Saccharolobus shibatae TaxID=2286 RepID=A0A8F5C1Z3_9CREN|nr:hypothetical protein [Saccharolobus shibatae]QXJ35511.1 hypothetical protein J5U22_02058 [Saccharolobus shibatae]